jgi:beta-propeller repeat-containing protein/centrosomal CEP192-like protein
MKLKLCTALLTAVTLFVPLSSVAEKAPDAAAAKRTAVEAYGRLPLSFEATASPAHYLARNGSYAVLIGAGQSSVAVKEAKSGKHQTLRFAFENANPAAKLEAMEPQPGVTNYYLGHDASKWRLGVQSYGRLRSAGVYPGVDVVYYGDHRRLEFDYVVAPKADPSAIVLSFSGMDKFYKESSGDLVAEVAGQPVRFAKPYAYQKVDGTARPVDSEYVLAADGKVHLHLGQYDRNRELIVDPVVAFATYLGGSAADTGNGIAVDSTGSAYVTGQTCSSDFPDSPNPSLLTFEGACDAFVTKYSPGGAAYEFTTILGGSMPAGAAASGNGIALDAANPPNVYITGTTNIEDLPGAPAYSNPPVVLNSYQGGDSDAFIVVLNGSGTLQRTSYLGGSGADSGYGIVVDQATPPNVTVVGQTCSQDFPGYSAFETKVEPCVAFVTKLDNNLDIGYAYNPPGYSGASALSSAPPNAGGKTYYFSEFYGGQPVAPYPTGGAWQPVTGYTAGALVEDNQNPPHIELALNTGVSGPYVPAGTTLELPTPNWNTTTLGITLEGSMSWEDLGTPGIPPNAFTEAYGVAIDPQGDIFAAGGTNTAALASTIWPCSNGASGAWVLKVYANGTRPGGCAYEWTLETTPTDLTATLDTSRAIAVDSEGRAYVTGTMTGGGKTTGNSYNQTNGGNGDAFLARINQAGSAIDYFTYLGGSGKDEGLGVAVDGSFGAYVTGLTQSSDFPIINPLTDPNSLPVANAPIATIDGLQDAFITKFTADGSALIFSAYLGGSAADQGNAIALDTTNQGNMYVVGQTYSTDLVSNLIAEPFMTYTPPQPYIGGGNPDAIYGDAFVAMVPGSSLPTVTITPGSLNFGALDVGMTSQPVAVQYTNTNASSSVSINSITFGGNTPGAGDFMQVFPGTAPGDCAAGVILPDTYCNIWVVFTPSAGGPRSSTLFISDDTSTQAHVVSVSGTGEQPKVSLAPTSLVFAATTPYQPIGVQTAAQTLTLTNTGQGILDIGGITIGGTNPDDFNLSDGCNTTLASGSSCNISVTFTPSAAGVRTAILTIADNVPGSPTQSVTLQGTGAPVATPKFAPPSLTFPSQALNTASASQSVTITNTDTASTLDLTTPVATSGFQVVALSGSCGTTLAPSSSCVIGVTFTPTASGPLAGTLSVSTNAPSLPVIQVTLTGTGAAAVVPTGTISLAFVAPATGSFGPQTVGITSAAQTVTLTNTAATTLSVTGIAVIPAVTGNTDFGFGSGGSCSSTLPFNLAANASCSIQVTFTPSVTGAESASLKVTGGSSNSPQSLALTGTGTAAGTGGSDFNVTPVNFSGGESVVQGGTASYALSVAPVGSYTGTVTFTVTGLPAGTTWSVSPNPLTLNGAAQPGSAQAVTLTVSTSGGSGSAARAVPPGSLQRSIFLALLPFSVMGMLLMNKRRGMWLVLGLVLLCLLLGMVGCGGGSGSGSSGLAAGGPYSFTLVATSTGGAEVQNIPMQLVVSQQ